MKLISSLTETIHHMYTEELKIWTGCEYIYNKYDDGTDGGFFMCHDRINALAVESLTRETEYDALVRNEKRENRNENERGASVVVGGAPGRPG